MMTLRFFAERIAGSSYYIFRYFCFACATFISGIRSENAVLRSNQWRLSSSRLKIMSTCFIDRAWKTKGWVSPMNRRGFSSFLERCHVWSTCCVLRWATRQIASLPTGQAWVDDCQKGRQFMSVRWGNDFQPGAFFNIKVERINDDKFHRWWAYSLVFSGLGQIMIVLFFKGLFISLRMNWN